MSAGLQAAQQPALSLIVALDRNRAIGRGGMMPWHLPDDLIHFKQQTLGKPVLMGRRTFESIGRALPGRRNLVLSRNPAWAASSAGIEIVDSLDGALQLCRAAVVPELMVIGGAQIYAQAMPLATTLWLTEVDTAVEGPDTWFPQWDAAQWREVWREQRAADARHAFARTFKQLVRRDV